MKKKTGKIQVLCLTGGVLLFLLAEWMAMAENKGVLEQLPRNSYGEGEATYELMVSGMEEEYPLEITVGERQYLPKEATEVFENIMSTMGDRIRGKNPSLTEVRYDLELMTWLEEEGVKLRWSSSDPDLIDSFGQIQEADLPEEGCQVFFQVELSSGEYRAGYEIPIWLYPVLLSEKEAAAAGLKQKIQQLDQEQKTEAYLVLPTEYEGTTLHYRNQTDAHNEILLVLGLVLAVLCYAKEQMAAEEKKKQYRQELLMDYAEVVFKLKVFTGAGMTIASSWEKIVLDYEKRLKGHKTKPRAAYEEMKKTWNQLQCGLPEGQAYGEFGKRCGLQPYLKLSSLLEQNRKTGTKNFSSLLETEMTAAWEDRKTMAKRLGEEAGTKLLFPLFLMLGIVMVIIMVPAMLSMT